MKKLKFCQQEDYKGEMSKRQSNKIEYNPELLRNISIVFAGR